MDGVALSPAVIGSPISTNPGRRVFEARRGQELARVDAVLGIGDRKLVTLRLAPPLQAGSASLISAPRAVAKDDVLDRDVSPATFDWRTVGWIGLGTGATALVFSGAAGLVAADKKNEFSCSGGDCVHDNQGEIDEYETFVTLATVGYISGALLAGAGLWILLEADDPSASVKLSLGPGSASIAGTF